MENMDRKRFYTLLIFSLVLLFNPNINLIDIMPDFIAWFILTKLFERAADSAVYFEEARASFVKLGWLNLAKILGLIMIVIIRGHDTSDNNVYALFSLSFAIGEIILSLSAAKNIFSALFHLGERTDATALISPFVSPISKSRTIDADALKEYTYFFLICKCVLYVLPDVFLLTKVSDRGVVYTISRYYPLVFVFSQLLGVIIGAIWLARIIKYVKAVFNEGKFTESLKTMVKADSEERFNAKVKLRSISTALTIACISTIFTLELAFSNFDGIDILPDFIYGILLTVSLFILRRHSMVTSPVFILGGLFSALSLTTYIIKSSFLSSYGYGALTSSESARNLYLVVQIFGIIELLLLVAFLLLVSRSLNSFITSHTGLSPDSARYSRTEMDYHASLKKKNYIFTALGIVAGLAKCIGIFINGEVRVFLTEIATTVTTSSIPWYNLIPTFTAILYIAYALYYTSTLKEEVKMKAANGESL